MRPHVIQGNPDAARPLPEKVEPATESEPRDGDLQRPS